MRSGKSRENAQILEYFEWPLAVDAYGVATSSRLLTITGVFCKRALQKRLYSAKEAYNFKEPTNYSHPTLANMRRKTDAFRNIPRFDHPLEEFPIPFKILHIVLTSMHRKTFAIRNAGMGWLRLVGSLKLQVSLAEYRLFCRALLQKRPIILRSLLIVATPYASKDMCTIWYLVVLQLVVSNFKSGGKSAI